MRLFELSFHRATCSRTVVLKSGMDYARQKNPNQSDPPESAHYSRRIVGCTFIVEKTKKSQNLARKNCEISVVGTADLE